MKHSKYSVIVIGSGIAGLYAAIKLSETMNLPDGILLLTKSQLSESNSRYAQGGIVGVLPENSLDSVSLHVSDTIKAGCGLSDFNVVKFVSENSQHAINDLIGYGVDFDRDSKDSLTFTLEGAHSVRRILHVGGDATGFGIEKALVNKVKNDEAIAENISIYEQSHAVELLIDSKGECRGIIAFNGITNEFETIYAAATVLATGGTGQVYKYTTNPSVATGDGLALAIRAGADIKDMEFIQFHPTALSLDNDESRFLISESVRGEGAKLVNDRGEYFMDYHPQKDLAPRDIVTRAIYSQMEESKIEHVYLDASLIPIEKFKKRFPNIYNTCLKNGIDVTKDLIPVSPAAHYCMGGIKTSIDGKTSIKNLYAIGEVACTSLHGANRLASNSLLECVVTGFELVNTLSFTNLEGSDVIDDAILSTLKKYSDEDAELPEDFDVSGAISKLKNSMWINAGIIRDENTLLQAVSDINNIWDEFGKNRFCTTVKEFELRNLLHIAGVITNMALKRKESVGAHFRSDYIVPESNERSEVKHDESIPAK